MTSAKFNAIIERNSFEQPPFHDRQLLQEDLGMDSLDLVELVMDIEAELGIDITDDDAYHWHSVGDVRHYLRKRGYNV
jgi:acyl carrier protein